MCSQPFKVYVIMARHTVLASLKRNVPFYTHSHRSENRNFLERTFNTRDLTIAILKINEPMGEKLFHDSSVKIVLYERERERTKNGTFERSRA